jgi:hypothetical protein
VEACHGDIDASTVVESHQSVECVVCHDSGGRDTAITTMLFRAAHPFIGASDDREATVSSDNSLECHDDVSEGVIENTDRAVRVSHEEILAAGILCTECHDAGHEVRSPERMAICVRCHDGVNASAACETCHLADPATTVAARRPINREVLLPPIEDCGGCHAQDTCDDCHGIRMPHTGEFISGDHAMQAAFDRKETLCYRCHLPEDCGQCHGDWASHGDNFKQEHKSLVRGSNCNSCHHDHSGSFCARCHDGPGW